MQSSAWPGSVPATSAASAEFAFAGCCFKFWLVQTTFSRISKRLATRSKTPTSRYTHTVVTRSDKCTPWAGIIKWRDRLYASLSAFALAAIHLHNPNRQSCNGWDEVRYEGQPLVRPFCSQAGSCCLLAGLW